MILLNLSRQWRFDNKVLKNTQGCYIIERLTSSVSVADLIIIISNIDLLCTYDAVVTGTPNKYFEFKSVQNLPPSNFADQFTKDLNNPNITNLNQLKWMFDKAKYLKKAGITEANIEAKFVEDMKRAIDGLDKTKITNATLTKFNVADVDKLFDEIENSFGDIFYMK